MPALTIVLLLGAALPAGAAGRSPHRHLERPCTACHTTASWQEIVFDHETAFPLSGRHAGLQCQDCHSLEDFTSNQQQCTACHADYHQEALGGDCARCHDATAWKPNHFSHESTAFPLWGAHGALDCVQCHRNEVTYQFAAAPQTCLDCHQDAFARARAAVHLTAGPDCESCHALDAWSGGHDPLWMEIRGGRHEVACGRCHKFGENYQSHTCIDCHKFSQSIREHRGIDPLDARCRECHPNDFDDD